MTSSHNDLATIERRTLGKSGLKTPKLVLGGNVFGWTADEDTSFAVLDRFVESGGTLVDTADVYSAWVPGHKGGESEAVIGRWLKARGEKPIEVATKVGMLPGEGGQGLQPDRIRHAAEASLERLGVDTIDLYFAHRDDESVPLAEVLGAFKELIDAGKVKAIGASNYTAERLAEALKIADAHGLPRFTVLQPELNLVSRDKFKGALQDLVVAEDIGTIPYFGLASGFLTGKYRAESDLKQSQRGGGVAKYLAGNGPAVLAAMDDVAGETGASLAQIALAWNAAQPGVTAPIASATSVEQLDDLLGALTLELSDDQLAKLDAASRG